MAHRIVSLGPGDPRLPGAAAGPILPHDKQNNVVVREEIMYCRALVIAVGLAFTILVPGVAFAQTPAT
ncbi:MAG: hypothetical protein WA778_24110, partial [Pseudolabrys sp.]